MKSLLFVLGVLFYCASITYIHELGHMFFASLAGLEGHIVVFHPFLLAGGDNVQGKFILAQPELLSTIPKEALFFFFTGGIIFEFLYTILFVLLYSWVFFTSKKKHVVLIYSYVASSAFLLLVFSMSFYSNIITKQAKTGEYTDGYHMSQALSIKDGNKE